MFAQFLSNARMVFLAYFLIQLLLYEYEIIILKVPIFCLFCPFLNFLHKHG